MNQPLTDQIQKPSSGHEIRRDTIFKFNSTLIQSHQLSTDLNLNNQQDFEGLNTNLSTHHHPTSFLPPSSTNGLEDIKPSQLFSFGPNTPTLVSDRVTNLPQSPSEDPLLLSPIIHSTSARTSHPHQSRSHSKHTPRFAFQSLSHSHLLPRADHHVPQLDLNSLSVTPFSPLIGDTNSSTSLEHQSQDQSPFLVDLHSGSVSLFFTISYITLISWTSHLEPHLSPRIQLTNPQFGTIYPASSPSRHSRVDVNLMDNISPPSYIPSPHSHLKRDYPSSDSESVPGTKIPIHHPSSEQDLITFSTPSPAPSSHSSFRAASNETSEHESSSSQFMEITKCQIVISSTSCSPSQDTHRYQEQDSSIHSSSRSSSSAPSSEPPQAFTASSPSESTTRPTHITRAPSNELSHRPPSHDRQQQNDTPEPSTSILPPIPSHLSTPRQDRHQPYHLLTPIRAFPTPKVPFSSLKKPLRRGTPPKPRVWDADNAFQSFEVEVCDRDLEVTITCDDQRPKRAGSRISMGHVEMVLKNWPTTSSGFSRSPKKAHRTVKPALIEEHHLPQSQEVFQITTEAALAKKGYCLVSGSDPFVDQTRVRSHATLPKQQTRKQHECDRVSQEEEPEEEDQQEPKPQGEGEGGGEDEGEDGEGEGEEGEEEEEVELISLYYRFLANQKWVNKLD